MYTELHLPVGGVEDPARLNSHSEPCADEAIPEAPPGDLRARGSKAVSSVISRSTLSRTTVGAGSRRSGALYWAVRLSEHSTVSSDDDLGRRATVAVTGSFVVA